MAHGHPVTLFALGVSCAAVLAALHRTGRLAAPATHDGAAPGATSAAAPATG
ncbi:hypothetical protein OIE71_27370 [Streptomyces sp. NBC_01725]|uniref:hypothetical protein n=1 Tax=Streptomyces sp. NBC_01725 TaxID=2975923 RepID=UPI002E2AD4BE|nr:hypothetical protein [Streptomyces sp. NBC_01725]